jgi:hypothetical protein
MNRQRNVMICLLVLSCSLLPGAYLECDLDDGLLGFGLRDYGFTIDYDDYYVDVWYEDWDDDDWEDYYEEYED